jgi:hypothetical protein
MGTFVGAGVSSIGEQKSVGWVKQRETQQYLDFVGFRFAAPNLQK